LKAVALGYQAVLNDESAIIVAGGQESMSQVSASHLYSHCLIHHPILYPTSGKEHLCMKTLFAASF